MFDLARAAHRFGGHFTAADRIDLLRQARHRARHPAAGKPRSDGDHQDQHTEHAPRASAKRRWLHATGETDPAYFTLRRLHLQPGHGQLQCVVELRIDHDDAGLSQSVGQGDGAAVGRNRIRLRRRLPAEHIDTHPKVELAMRRAGLLLFAPDCCGPHRSERHRSDAFLIVAERCCNQHQRADRHHQQRDENAAEHRKRKQLHESALPRFVPIGGAHT